MNNTKCLECNFVNFLNALICKRCGKSLNEATKTASTAKFSEKTDDFDDFTDENRHIGIVALVAGIVATIAPWILTFKLQFFHGKLNGILVVCGFSFIIMGLAAIFDPPKTKLNADENKSRNATLFLIGLLLGAVEVYFFNKSLGVW